LLNKINDMLDYLQIEVRDFKLQVEECSLKLLMKELRRVAVPQLNGDLVEISFCLDKDLPERVLLDAARVRQVLLKMILNSIKYTLKGYIEVSISCEAPSSIKIQVKDSGIGMSQEDLRNLFHLFTVNKQEYYNIGTNLSGMGLTISQKICEMMGSKIKVSSVKNRGSIFWFTLPLISTSIPFSLDNRYSVSLEEESFIKVGSCSHSLDICRRHSVSLGGGCPLLNGCYKLVKCQSSNLLEREVTAFDSNNKLQNTGQYLRSIENSRHINHINLSKSVRKMKDEKMSDFSGSKRSLILEDCIPDELSEGELNPIMQMNKERVLRVNQGNLQLKSMYSLPVIISTRLSAKLSTWCSCPQILIVDDNRVNRVVMKSLLDLRRIKSAESCNGIEAIDLLKRQNEKRCCRGIALVFMDLQMPEMNGYEATLSIRSSIKEGEIKPTKIVALTAYRSETEKTKCFEVGMDGFEVKPMTPEALTFCLQQYM